jgi:hypothetical protein
MRPRYPYLTRRTGKRKAATASTLSLIFLGLNLGSQRLPWTCKEDLMQSNRFDAIAAELERLADEIAVINSQPFDPRIDLRSTRKAEKVLDDALPHFRNWSLHKRG